MNTVSLFLLAVSPLVLLLVLLLVLKIKLVHASITTLLYTIFISLFVWDVQTKILQASIIKGIYVGFDIALIIGGALLYIYFFKNSGRMIKLERLMQTLSDDKRVQVLLLGFFLVAFLEGTAGFGVPAAVVAPLLVGLAIAPITAVAIALVGDSTAVAFGAIGTPIRVGFETVDATGVAFTTAVLNAIVLCIIPLSILAIYEFQRKERNFKHFLSAIPLGFVATISFAIPFVFFAYFGYDFPSLLGAVFGTILFIIFVKLKLFLPKISASDTKKATHYMYKSSDLFAVLFPYALFIGLFVLIRFLTQQFDLFLHIPLSETISHTFNPFNPGIIFLLVVLIFAFSHNHAWRLSKGVRDVSHKLIYPFIIILAITAFVQIMVYSNLNNSGLNGMIQVIAIVLQTEHLLFVSGFIGVIGTFIAGSATVSNLLFAELQVSSAVLTSLPVVLVLALQLTGAAVGNMISLTNIVAAQTTVHLQNKEKDILKLTILPCILYMLLIGVVATVAFTFFF